jgi:hypothetical protein
VTPAEEQHIDPILESRIYATQSKTDKHRHDDLKERRKVDVRDNLSRSPIEQ